MKNIPVKGTVTQNIFSLKLVPMNVYISEMTAAYKYNLLKQGQSKFVPRIYRAFKVRPRNYGAFKVRPAEFWSNATCASRNFGAMQSVTRFLMET